MDIARNFLEYSRRESLSRSRPIDRKQILKKDLPQTVGKILTEEQLRAYAKCSEFSYRGGIDKKPFGLAVIQETVENLFLKNLKKDLENPLRDLHSCLLNAITKYNRTEQLLEPQLNMYMNNCILWLKEFFTIFPLSSYAPILGPIEPTMRISKTPIKLHLSGIFRSKKKQTLHAISFSTYASKHSMLNDPSALLKIQLLKPFVKEHLQTERSQVILHIFAYGKNGNLQYDTIDSNKVSNYHLSRVISLVETMELGHNYPVIPCNYSCPFKKDCFYV